MDQAFDKYSQLKNPDKKIKQWVSELDNHFVFDHTVIDTNSAAVYTDAKHSDIIGYDDISTVSEIYEYFNIDEDELKEILMDDPDYTESLEADIQSSYENEPIRDTTSLQMVRHVMSARLKTPMRAVATTQDWAVVEDGTTGVDAEIVSPVMNVRQGMSRLYQVFDVIEQEDAFGTNSSTGLHINIGTWTGDEYNSVDWLKFLMILEPHRVLDQFMRNNNEYAQNQLPKIIQHLGSMDIRQYSSVVNEINKHVFSSSPKFSAVNLSKLPKHGHIELRAPGNTDYTKRADEIETLIRKTIRALELASDPNALKSQYLKRLSKYVPEPQEPRITGTFWADQLGRKINSARPLLTLTMLLDRIPQTQLPQTLTQMDQSFDFGAVRELRDAIQQSSYGNDSESLQSDAQDLRDVLDKMPDNYRVVRMIKAIVGKLIK